MPDAVETTPLFAGKDPEVRVCTLCLSSTEKGGRNPNQEAPPSYHSVIKGIVVIIIDNFQSDHTVVACYLELYEKGEVEYVDGVRPSF